MRKIRATRPELPAVHDKLSECCIAASPRPASPNGFGGHAALMRRMRGQQACFRGLRPISVCGKGATNSIHSRQSNLSLIDMRLLFVTMLWPLSALIAHAEGAPPDLGISAQDLFEKVALISVEGTTLHYDGYINEGSVAEVERALKGAPLGAPLRVLVIHSRGGIADFGIPFGELVRDWKLSVIVDRACMSACANFVALPAAALSVPNGAQSIPKLIATNFDHMGCPRRTLCASLRKTKRCTPGKRPCFGRSASRRRFLRTPRFVTEPLRNSCGCSRATCSNDATRSRTSSNIPIFWLMRLRTAVPQPK